MNAVDFEEGQHNVHPDALVAVHKGMVGDQRKAEPRALFLFRRVKLLSVEGRMNALQRGLQQRLVADADAPAGFRRDQLVQ